MSDRQSLDDTGLHAITDQIGRDGHQLSASAGYSAAAFGKILETVAGGPQTQRRSLRGDRGELPDVVANNQDIDRRPPRPNYVSHSFGGGCSPGVPHVASHWEKSA